MFALESLSLAGEHYDNSTSVQKACQFLLGKQMADGGWGESYKVMEIRCRFRSLLLISSVPQSCETEQYVHHEKSQVVNTAWGEWTWTQSCTTGRRLIGCAPQLSLP